MIPCRIFLHQLELSPEPHSLHPVNPPPTRKPKITLTLNNLYYDEIKVFQTKYFCLTALDVVGVEAVFETDNGESMIGKMEIPNAYKLAIESQSVKIRIEGMPAAEGDDRKAEGRDRK